MPLANNKKYTKTSTIPLAKTPIIPDNHLLEVIAKIIPSNEKEPSSIIAKDKFAFGPLIIKNVIMLINTVRIDKKPNLFIHNTPLYLK